MARETLRDFLTSIGSGADSVSYVVRDDNGDGSVSRGDDLGIDPNTGKELVDLSSADAGLLGDYLSFIQENSDVVFNVSPGNSQAAPTNRGDSLPPAENQGANRVFVESTGGDQSSMSLSQYSNSGKFDQESVTLAEIVDKTSGEDGHTLLHDVGGKPIDTHGKLHVAVDPSMANIDPLIRSSVNILRENNRFSPAARVEGDAFVERGKESDDFNSEPTLTTQRKFGRYDGTETISLESLEEIGESLLKTSAGIIDSEKYPEKDLTSTVPTNKKDPEDLRARDAEGFPVMNSGDSVRSGRGSFLSGAPTENSTSFGSMTGEGTFSFDPGSKKYLRARAVAAIKTALLAIDTFKNIALESSAKINSKVESPRSPMLSGEHRSYIQYKMSVIMNSVLVPTEGSYQRCVNEGAKFMLGLTKNLSQIESRNQIEGIGKNAQIVKDSPGFSLALARSILLSVDSLNKLMADLAESYDSDSDAQSIVMKLGKTRVIGILNSLAIVGDIKRKIDISNSKAFGLPSGKNPWSVDDLPDGPTTRVSKSRTSDGHNVSALSMRTSATPSSFVLPVGVIRASTRMGMGTTDTNPTRILSSPSGKKVYTGRDIEGGKRIPSAVVHRMEDLLDAEYVPFYFHDIRTNEITSFHAFLETLQDGFTANFTETTGYGRLDAVQTYSSTKRDISFSFTVAATSPEDFDEMWLKINKLTTLVYPQWTMGDLLRGGRVNDGESTFIQPFSQVIGSTPLVRVRIGDLIKGNYSKFNLGRIFGVGESQVSLKSPVSGLGAFGDFLRGGGIGGALSGLMPDMDEIFLKIFFGAFGSPMSAAALAGGDLASGISNVKSAMGSTALGGLQSAGSKLLVNGFAHPILNVILRRYNDPDNDPAESAISAGNILGRVGSKISSFGTSKDGYAAGRVAKNRIFGTRVYVKASQAKSYRVISKDGEDFKAIKKVRFSRPVLCIVTGRTATQIENSNTRKNRDNDKSRTITMYRMKIIDFNVPKGLFGAELQVSHSDIIHNPNDTFSRYMMPVLNPGAAIEAFAGNLINEGAKALGVDASGVGIALSEEMRFLSAGNNAIVKSFESTRGRGLAGVIKGLKFDWLTENTPWEIDWGSRAPQVCKVTVTFAPIHDIPPGIDHEGFNRAPIYNVGKLSHAMSGDAYDDGGQSSSETYDFEHRKNFKNE